MARQKLNPRGVATLPLSPLELDQVFVRPRVHLDLLLNGLADRSHLGTIAGVLNLGCGLAAVKKNEQLTREVNQAVEVLSEAAKADPPRLPSHNTKPFIALMSKIEVEARKTPRKTMVAAMVWVHQALLGGDAEIRRLDDSATSEPPRQQTAP